MASRMAGTERSRGECLEQVGGDFLAGMPALPGRRTAVMAAGRAVPFAPANIGLDWRADTKTRPEFKPARYVMGRRRVCEST